jgi:MYXO-CTERM domain-containing protein
MSLFWIGFAVQTAVASVTSPMVQRAAVLDQYHSHMEGLHDHRPGERGMCLTGLIQELEASWHLLEPGERAEITENLAPFKDDLFEPLVPTPSPPSAATESCWGTQKDHVLNSAHFSVQWDEGLITLAQAQAFSDSLEESWAVEVDELGWREPQGSNLYLMLVMVENLGGSGAGAYTTVDSCGMGRLPYVVANTGSFSAGSWYKTMACHELHHAIQYSYGFAHEFWWWEATSTWVEDLVYPFANDWAGALYMFAQTPYIGMNAFAGNSNNQELFWHTYGMGIWGMYLDQHVGGNELVRETWEAVLGMTCQYCAWMPDVIEDIGHDFDELMAGFMAHTSMMDYRDRVMLTDATRSDTVRSLPSTGESGSNRPQSLGMNIIEFDADAGRSGHELEVSFDGASGADRWVAVLSVGDNTLEEYTAFELDEDGAGVAWIPFDGSAAAHLIVSPVYASAQGYNYSWRSADDFSYVWSAQLVEAGSGDDTGTDEAGEEDPFYVPPALSPEDDAKSGCGCSSAPSGSMAWLVLGLIGLVGRRRR